MDLRNKIFLTGCLLFNYLCFAQKFDEKKMIHQLWFVSSDLAHSGKFKESLLLNKKLIKECSENDFRIGLVMGYYNFGNCLSLMGEYKKSIFYLDLAIKENEKEKNKEMEALIYTANGNNYSGLGLYTVSLKYFHRVVNSAIKISRKERIGYLINFAYSNMGDIYEKMGRVDSAYYYKKAAYGEAKDSYNTLQLANFFNDYRYNEDSVKHYLNEATVKWGGKTDVYTPFTVFDKFLLNKSWGKYYERKHDYVKSSEFYERSLENAIECNTLQYMLEAYKDLSEISQKKKDFVKASEYFSKYVKIKDSINDQQNKSVDFSVKKILDETEKEYNTQKYRLRYIITAISLLLIICIYFFYFFFKKRRKIQNELERDKKTLAEKNNIIINQENETQQLRNRVKDGFDEVILLAKQNSPEFIARFIEVYPDFYQALLKIYPDINTETLKFCALLRLNFSTKEIAQYNFITPRAIQLRKNRVRKKLNISSTEDIYMWMNNLERRGLN